MVMSVVALRPVARGQEVLVNYNYALHLARSSLKMNKLDEFVGNTPPFQAPDWYRDLYFHHLRYVEGRSEEFVYGVAKRRSREAGGAHVRVPPPERTDRERFLPCGVCGEHVAFDCFSVR